jgi:hypothetical protein
VRDRIPAGSILTLGLCLATLALVLGAVQATAFEAGPLRDHARSMLEQEPVQRNMAKRVADAISAQVPAGAAVDPLVLRSVALRTLDQPSFVHAFGAGLDQVRAHVVDGAVNPIALDPTLVGQAVSAAAAGQPQLASLIPPGQPIAVQIPDDNIPDLARWADLWKTAVRVLAFVALLLITYGLLRVEHRPWAIGRIGRWAVAIGIAALVLFWFVPHIVLTAIGGWIGVAGVALGANAELVPIGLALVAGGAALVLAAHRWELRDRRRFLAVVPRPGTPGGAASRWESPV